MDDVTPRARAHKRVREQHANELAQDYVEAICQLLRERDDIRIRDLQNVFGVSHVTVIRTLQRLEEGGLVTGARSKEIRLTKKGELMAKESERRHLLIRDFFIKIGVSPEQADADAEGAEHHLSTETLAAIRHFMGLEEDSPAQNPVNDLQ